MRTTKTITVSVTPEQLLRARQLAKKENRTMSELVREALRRYQQDRFWERVGAHRLRAEALGIEEQDVVPMIRAWRKDLRLKKVGNRRSR